MYTLLQMEVHVSLRHRLRTIACCAILEMAAIFGMPMRQEQIEDLMRTLNEPKIARATPDESHRGDGSQPGDGQRRRPTRFAAGSGWRDNERKQL